MWEGRRGLAISIAIILSSFSLILLLTNLRHEQRNTLLQMGRRGLQDTPEDASEDWGDPPDYVRHHHELYNISYKETYIGEIVGPWEGVTWNMAFSIMHPNNFYNATPCFESSSPLVLYVFSSGRLGSNYFFSDTYRSTHNNISTTPRIIEWGTSHIELVSHDGMSSAVIEMDDCRLFQFRDKVYTAFVGVGAGGLQSLYLGELNYNCSSKKLLVSDVFRLSTEHEMGRRHEKNWAAWTYHNSSHPQLASEILLFSHSINPHRIVHGNETFDTSPTGSTFHFDRTRRVHTVAVTEMINPPYWPYGPLHGGTNAILIDTAEGPKYLSVFHSQTKYMASWCLTYFMGAYIFNPRPPFEITHISSVPIIPKKLYKISTSSWAFKAIDYILFPMSIQSLDRETILVSMGRNDREGWTMTLNVTSLVQSLTPVNTRVLSNRFYEHFGVQDH